MTKTATTASAGKNAPAKNIPPGRKKKNQKTRTEKVRVVNLHPENVATSTWMNRHVLSFLSNEFLELKKDLFIHRKNHIPVLVRPNPSYAVRGAKAAGIPRWQLVYGNFRHQACKELGIPIRAIIENLSDIQLVTRIHSENRLRTELSAYERGLFYTKLLDQKLFSSMRKLANQLHIDVSDVSRTTFLARLPAEVLLTMYSPLDLSIHAADKLRPAWESNPDEMLRRAKEINQAEGPLAANEAVLRLTQSSAKSVGASNTLLATAKQLELGGRVFGQLNISKDGHVTIQFNKPLNQLTVIALETVILDFAKKHSQEFGTSLH